MEYYLSKLANLLLTCFLALSFIFVGIRMAPGDPVREILGEKATPEEISKLKSELNLDKSIPLQYLDYIKDLIKGDLGKSIYKNKPVTSLVLVYLKPTILLAFGVLALSFILGTGFGVWAGISRGKGFDLVFKFLSLAGLSIPIFSLAPLLVLLFSIKLNFFPVSGWGEGLNYFLPLITLVIPLGSILSRVARNKFLEECHAPWVQVLHAKGLSRFEVNLRVVKVVLPSIFNVLAIQTSVVLAGTIITESIFDIPGLGMLLFESIQDRDYPVVQGLILYSTIIYMLVYFMTDLLNEKIDPRIKP